MTRLTTRFDVPGQPEIGLDVDLETASRESADHVVAMLEEMVRNGSRIGDGQVIQMGWSLLRVIAGPDGSLALHEPDGKSVPMDFKPGITDSLWQMLLQLWHADSFGLDRTSIALPNMRQSVIQCSGLSQATGVVLSRSAPNDPMDSGWFIGCTEPAHDHDEPRELDRISLYQAFVLQPKIAPWIGFPVTSMILLAPGEHPQVYVADHSCPLVKDSFVDQALHHGP